jgi:hypothetical protein
MIAKVAASACETLVGGGHIVRVQAHYPRRCRGGLGPIASPARRTLGDTYVVEVGIEKNKILRKL